MDSLLPSFRKNRLHEAPKPAHLPGIASLIVPDDERPPTIAARLAVFPLLFIPWLILYESVVNLGPPPGAFRTYLPGELQWPVWQWTELLYVSPYLLVALAPFVATTNRQLRRFTITGILATVVGHLIFLALPAIAPPRSFAPHGLLGGMMLLDRDLDLNNGTAALPSFHAFWAFLGASIFAARWPRWRYLAWAWATGVSVSCVFTGMHGALDIIAGFGLYLVTWFHLPILLALNRHRSALEISATQTSIEIGWNVLLVALMLHLSRRPIAPAVTLIMYLILWTLMRLAHASLRPVAVVNLTESSSARPSPVPFGMPSVR